MVALGNWNAIKLIEFRTRKVCEVDGCDNPATQAHHVFLRRNAKRKKYVDVVENMQMSCASCNVTSKKADRWDNTMAFMEEQVYRGHDIVGWLTSLPDQMKRGDRFKSLLLNATRFSTPD